MALPFVELFFDEVSRAAEAAKITKRMEARLEVRLRPRSRSDELIGMRDGVLQARVSAAPVDGKANRALCRLLAKRLNVAPSQVSVVRGDKSREKLIRVEGIDRAGLEAALSGL